MIDYKKIANQFIKRNQSLLKQKSNNGQVAVALVAGLALGAVLSILFAPKKGSVTRRFIGNKSKHAYTSLKDKYASKINHEDLELKLPAKKRIGVKRTKAKNI